MANGRLVFCAVCFAGVGYWLAVICAHLLGIPPVLAAAGTGAGFAIGMLTSPPTREDVLRWVARRPAVPPMTAADYRQLRGWEAGLGWELTEVPPGVPEAGPAPARPELTAEARRAILGFERRLQDLERRRLIREREKIVVAHPWLPGACTHPADRDVHFVATGGARSVYCGACGTRLSGRPQPQRTDELVRNQILAGFGVPPPALAPVEDRWDGLG